ncbi:MAG: hypothetical protein AAF383_28995 [Cyanobacteria bacterium P01_A01_bin.83]
MLTELDRIILIATASGFLGGSFCSILDYVLQTRVEHQAITPKQFWIKYLFASCLYSFLLGLGVFVMAVYDTSISTAELNKFTIVMAIFFSITPINDRFWSFIFSRWSKY